MTDSSYAGDLAPREVWERMAKEPSAQLVDVRTAAEWNYVGIPELTGLNREPLLCEWQRFPDGGVNPTFTIELGQLLAKAGYVKGAPVYFLCRSGARSRSAAIAMTRAGYAPCFNIKDGFEGPLDGDSHRGHAAGWKADHLPWIQG